MFEELDPEHFCVITSAPMTLSTVVKIKDPFNENESDKCLIIIFLVLHKTAKLWKFTQPFFFFILMRKLHQCVKLLLLQTH